MTRHRAPLDQHAARELDLYAQNTGELYPMFQAIIKNLKSKIAKGTYSPALAPVAWLHWYDAAAKRYVSEIGGTLAMFPRSMRVHLAEQRAKDEYRRIRNGEHG